jgi:hypothetical protein
LKRLKLCGGMASIRKTQIKNPQKPPKISKKRANKPKSPLSVFGSTINNQTNRIELFKQDAKKKGHLFKINLKGEKKSKDYKRWKAQTRIRVVAGYAASRKLPWIF